MEIQTAYQSTLDYLYERLPMFSRLGKEAIKNDLINIRKFCEALDQPQEKFKCIHIAGTNGKGSTSHMLAAILQDAGYKTGLYTSPHLIDFRERIKINGIPVSKEWVIDFVAKHKTLIESIEPSFFEITVAMAFQAFAEEGVAIAIIETGLGGRLDSTNIITPILSIITNISYDHKDLLGNTLQEIAREKAGIIKPNIPVLIGEQEPETERIFFETAVRNSCTIYYAEPLWDLVRIKQDAQFQYFKAVEHAQRKMYDLQTDMLGSYQQYNIKTALAATEILITNHRLNLSIENAIKSFSRIKNLTQLRGRWEILQEHPLIIVDVAHNPSGIKQVMEQWKQVDAHQKHIVAGFVKDKEVSEALALFPKDAKYYFCNANTPRAMPSEGLSIIAKQFELHGNFYNSVREAIQNAQKEMKADHALLITGSFFVVGEAMEYFAV